MSTQPLTAAEFRVDLQQLEDAISTIQQQAETVALCTSTIGTMLTSVPSYWTSPAEVPFSQLAQACTRQMSILSSLLAEMVSRMRTAYQNYLDAEQTNYSSFQAPSGR
jgi:WXG100 family type VII secretion target